MHKVHNCFWCCREEAQICIPWCHRLSRIREKLKVKISMKVESNSHLDILQDNGTDWFSLYYHTDSEHFQRKRLHYMIQLARKDPYCLVHSRSHSHIFLDCIANDIHTRSRHDIQWRRDSSCHFLIIFSWFIEQLLFLIDFFYLRILLDTRRCSSSMLNCKCSSHEYRKYLLARSLLQFQCNCIHHHRIQVHRRIHSDHFDARTDNRQNAWQLLLISQDCCASPS